MKIYKRNQGRYTRLISAMVMLLLSCWGAVSMFKLLIANSAPMWLAVVAPVLLILLVVVAAYMIFNGQKAADFMIATEGEMKKVSWSTKEEVIGSTKVVIVTTFMMAGFLFMVDWVFRIGFKLLGVIE